MNKRIIIATALAVGLIQTSTQVAQAQENYNYKLVLEQKLTQEQKEQLKKGEPNKNEITACDDLTLVYKEKSQGATSSVSSGSSTYYDKEDDSKESNPAKEDKIEENKNEEKISTSVEEEKVDNTSKIVEVKEEKELIVKNNKLVSPQTGLENQSYYNIAGGLVLSSAGAYLVYRKRGSKATKAMLMAGILGLTSFGVIESRAEAFVEKQGQLVVGENINIPIIEGYEYVGYILEQKECPAVNIPGNNNPPAKTTDSFNPTGKDQTVKVGAVVDPNLSIDKDREKYPEGTKFAFKEDVDTSKEGAKDAIVLVTYPDGSTDEVKVIVNVKGPVDANVPMLGLFVEETDKEGNKSYVKLLEELQEYKAWKTEEDYDFTDRVKKLIDILNDADEVRERGFKYELIDTEAPYPQVVVEGTAIGHEIITSYEGNIPEDPEKRIYGVIRVKMTPLEEASTVNVLFIEKINENRPELFHVLDYVPVPSNYSYASIGDDSLRPFRYDEKLDKIKTDEFILETRNNEISSKRIVYKNGEISIINPMDYNKEEWGPAYTNFNKLVGKKSDINEEYREAGKTIFVETVSIEFPEKVYVNDKSSLTDDEKEKVKEAVKVAQLKSGVPLADDSTIEVDSEGNVTIIEKGSTFKISKDNTVKPKVVLDSPIFDDITKGDNSISGVAPAGKTVKVILPNNAELTGIANEEGIFEIDLPEGTILNGDDVVKGITLVSDENKEIQSVESSTTVINKEPIIAKQKTPVIIGDVYELHTTISGKGEPNATIVLTFTDGQVEVQSNDNGDFSVDIPSNITLRAGEEISVMSKKQAEGIVYEDSESTSVIIQSSDTGGDTSTNDADK